MNELTLPLSLAEHWMAQAYELALGAGQRDEVPVGAILVSKGEIIGAGSNARESSKRTTAHAEIMALEDFSHRASSWRVPVDTYIFTTAEPCLMCTGALLWARVDRVIFGCHDPKGAGLQKISAIIQAGTYDHRFIEVRGGVLGERCSSMMSSYFRQKRNAHPPKPALVNAISEE